MVAGAKSMQKSLQNHMSLKSCYITPHFGMQKKNIPKESFVSLPQCFIEKRRKFKEVVKLWSAKLHSGDMSFTLIPITLKTTLYITFWILMTPYFSTSSF